MAAADLARTAIPVVAALIYIALERRFPYTPGQRLFRAGFWSDLLLYTFLQSFALGFVINGFNHWLDRVIDGRLHLVGSWPLPAQALFFFVVHDFYIYWFHRAQHRFPWLWRIHEAHHSTRDVDWLSGSRSHILEILVNQTIEFAPILILGAPIEITYFKLAIDAVWGMYIHSNINVRSGALQYVFNGPEMHRWHHATDVIDVNFGTKLAIWDWLFGTAHLPKTKPTGYGLVGAEYPDGYLAQQIHALRPRRNG